MLCNFIMNLHHFKLVTFQVTDVITSNEVVR